MADKPEQSSEFRGKDEPVSLAPLTPEEALRALLAVKPDERPEERGGLVREDERDPNEVR